jgi:hypothetical protein
MKLVVLGSLAEVGEMIEASGARYPGIGLRLDNSPYPGMIIYIAVSMGEAKRIGASLFDRVSITIETHKPDQEPGYEPA